MESIKNGGTLPAPLNIIPTPKSVMYIFKRFFKKLKFNGQKKPEQFSDEINESKVKMNFRFFHLIYFILEQN